MPLPQHSQPEEEDTSGLFSRLLAQPAHPRDAQAPPAKPENLIQAPGGLRDAYTAVTGEPWPESGTISEQFAAAELVRARTRIPGPSPITAADLQRGMVNVYRTSQPSYDQMRAGYQRLCRVCNDPKCPYSQQV